MSYPILLDLRDRPVVVIGGGRIAARKIAGLLEAGARVTVISPALHPQIAALGDQITVRLTAYQPGMLAELRPLLVFAATDSRAVNQQVAGEARALGILANVADEGADGDFTNMATFRRGAITIGIATGGASPALSAHLRARIEAVIGDEYAILARWLGDWRTQVRQNVPAEKRRDLWRAILDSPALDQLRAGDEVGARAIIEALIAGVHHESD